MDSLLWSDLVKFLYNASTDVFNAALSMISLFMTPFGDIWASNTSIPSWITDVIAWIFNLFGVDILSLSPLQFMFGSMVPIIVMFTIYRYVKQ